MKRPASWPAAALIATACLGMSACKVGPDFKAPEPPKTPAYAAPGDAPLPAEQRVVLGARIEGDWWEQFHSSALDGLIKLALAGNLDLAAAKARVAQAQEEENAARAALMPALTFGTTVGRQKYGKSLFGPLDFLIPPFTYYTVGPGITAPLDLFGGNKRAVEERAAYHDYQQEELSAAYLSLTANIAAQTLNAAAARAQIEVVENII
ncbi:MAG TPA: TolC family protein, partial [Steroidobacteraceae bacterium]|nr:TolC family protein [Steroidobacteraceae bacterium]